jgi:hypothetical protein
MHPLHSRLANYITDSRNLVCVKDNNRRQKLLLEGKTSIVAHLSKLLKTQHFPLSFAVDLTLFTVSSNFSSLNLLHTDAVP